MLHLRTGPFNYLVLHHPDTAKVFLGSGMVFSMLLYGHVSIRWLVCVCVCMCMRTHVCMCFER